MTSLAKRVAFQVECGWEFNLNDGWRKWLFCVNYSVIRAHRLKICFWPHAWVRVLGFWFGVGFMYVSLDSIPGAYRPEK